MSSAILDKTTRVVLDTRDNSGTCVTCDQAAHGGNYARREILSSCEMMTATLTGDNDRLRNGKLHQCHHIQHRKMHLKFYANFI